MEIPNENLVRKPSNHKELWKLKKNKSMLQDLQELLDLSLVKDIPLQIRHRIKLVEKKKKEKKLQKRPKSDGAQDPEIDLIVKRKDEIMNAKMKGTDIAIEKLIEDMIALKNVNGI